MCVQFFVINLGVRIVFVVHKHIQEMYARDSSKVDGS